MLNDLREQHKKGQKVMSGRGCGVACVTLILLMVAIPVTCGIWLYSSYEEYEEGERTPATARPRSTASTPTSSIPIQIPIPGFGDGVWRVGRDIGPGTYRSPRLDLCYWERLSGFGGTIDDVITNGIGDHEMIVEIKETDRGFLSDGCHWWTLIDP